jgi:predicted ester cyclase
MKRTMAFVLLLFAPAWAAIASTPTSPVPTEVSLQEKNKAVARRVFDEIFNQGKFQVADEIYAPDFVNHGLHRDASLQEDQAWARSEKQACPDLTISYGPMVAEGDLVSVLWIARGTNTTSMGWLPATGAKIEMRGITIWRVVDGKLREEWTAGDKLRVINQIVDQLKWQLLGLLCLVVFLLWLVCRAVRMLWRRCVTAKG